MLFRDIFARLWLVTRFFLDYLPYLIYSFQFSDDCGEVVTIADCIVWYLIYWTISISVCALITSLKFRINVESLSHFSLGLFTILLCGIGYIYYAGGIHAVFHFNTRERLDLVNGHLKLLKDTIQFVLPVCVVLVGYNGRYRFVTKAIVILGFLILVSVLDFAVSGTRRTLFMVLAIYALIYFKSAKISPKSWLRLSFISGIALVSVLFFQRYRGVLTSEKLLTGEISSRNIREDQLINRSTSYDTGIQIINNATFHEHYSKNVGYLFRNTMRSLVPGTAITTPEDEYVGSFGIKSDMFTQNKVSDLSANTLAYLILDLGLFIGPLIYLFLVAIVIFSMKLLEKFARDDYLKILVFAILFSFLSMTEGGILSLVIYLRYAGFLFLIILIQNLKYGLKKSK